MLYHPPVKAQLETETSDMQVFGWGLQGNRPETLDFGYQSAVIAHLISHEHDCELPFFGVGVEEDMTKPGDQPSRNTYYRYPQIRGVILPVTWIGILAQFITSRVKNIKFKLQLATLVWSVANSVGTIADIVPPDIASHAYTIVSQT